MNTHAPVPLDRRAAPVMGLLSLRVYCPEVDLVSLGAFLRLRDVPLPPLFTIKATPQGTGFPANNNSNNNNLYN